MHVLAAERDESGRLELVVETDQDLAGCPSCGVVATGHGRRMHRARDAPGFGAPAIVCWRKRIWRCPEPACVVGTFSESHPLIEPRAKLTSRAIEWAVRTLAWDDTTVSALARQLGVDWHTLMDAITAHAGPLVDDPGRLDGVHVLGVDEHIWRRGFRPGLERAVTGMVDLTRDEHGRLRARLLDVVPGRTGTAYARWLRARPEGFTPHVRHAVLDPFRGYAKAIREELPDAVPVLDAFHVVQLATKALDEVRRRVQHDTLGHRGRTGDPLYRIRGLLRHGAEHLNPRQVAKLEHCLQEGDPTWEVTLAWHTYQRLRAIYHAPTAEAGHRLAEHVITTYRTCPIPEIARLGRTLNHWRHQILAYFSPEAGGRVSNGGTEAINLIIEKTRRLAHGFRNFHNYRLRILLTADGTRPYRRPRPTHA